MFTGIVKLAQIDDYILPSQNCIQPKIMKEANKPQKATVSLNDCLACSGCITSAESVLIEQMSVQKLMKQLNSSENRSINIIIAPQVVLSLSIHYKLSPQQIFSKLNSFFKQNFKVNAVLDLMEGISLCHQLVAQEYLNKKQKTLLCSQCPGWICYAQKTLTQGVVNLISKIKSPQQIMARLLKQKEKGCLVVSVMPCYDKKLQAIRFDIEEGVKELDITITTTQLINLYTTVKNTEFSWKQDDVLVKKDYFLQSNANIPYHFLNDQTSNGYIQNLITSLNGQDIKRIEIKNSDFIEYEFKIGEQTVKMAKCYGFRNIQKIVQAIKKNKCQYQYVEIMACPGGCYNGGGQMKIQNTKPKEIALIFGKIASQILYSQKEKINKMTESLIPYDRFYAKYKVIEKSLTQSVMNW